MFGKKISQRKTTLALESLGLEELTESEQVRVSGGHAHPPVYHRMTIAQQMEAESHYGQSISIDLF
ncbi:MAG TPA: hypothetical protein VFF73_06775 [Planctomycetota bacterium]|nr:hypothetical protein [Planctomycetota bacterium]